MLGNRRNRANPALSSRPERGVVDCNVKKGVFAVAEGVALDTDGNIYVGETIPATTLAGQPGGHIVRKFERLK